MRTLLLAALLAGQSAAQTPGSPAPSEPGATPSHAASRTEPTSAAMAEAMANRSLAKTRPSFTRQPDYRRPEAARDRGEFGEVVLSGIIGADGRFTEAQIKVSSRSSIIDDTALAAVPTFLFQPARDADGKAISVSANLPLEYPHVEFRGKDGLAEYRCAQAVRDYDWWNRTWPADKKDRVFATLRGMVVMSDLGAGRKPVDFDAEWGAAIESCRTTPDRKMLDLLHPHGSFIRDLLRK